MYCKEKSFALGSNEAKEAHTIINKEKAEGNNIIDINELSREEIDELLEKIKKQIEDIESKSNLSAVSILSSFEEDSNNVEKRKKQIEELDKNIELVNYWEEKYKQLMEIVAKRGTYKF